MTPPPRPSSALRSPASVDVQNTFSSQACARSARRSLSIARSRECRRHCLTSVDVGGVLREAGDVLALAQVDDMADCRRLVRRTQAVRERLQLIAAAGGHPQMTNLLQQSFGGCGPMPFDAPVIMTRLPPDGRSMGLPAVRDGLRCRLKFCRVGGAAAPTLHSALRGIKFWSHCKAIKWRH